MRDLTTQKFCDEEVIPVRKDNDKINELLKKRSIKDTKKINSKKEYFKKNKKYLFDDD